ncbi:uncharacterized protein LOC129899929 [Solanum dulcamara]|uniref:uncharacterized protein LOC129899929 n=1 Tax=Solanum dulcamara TaxID=45834 RepID=UPI002485FD31|nr:uncharacterized protein LOC129899929 [Solanum dulcamara]
MDFVVGLSKTLEKHDSIWVVVDRLMKSTHFILVRVDYNAQQLARIYVKKIVRLHRVPLSIILDRGTQFTSKFWDKLHEELGIQLTFNTTLLRACVIDFGEYWDKFLPLCESSYTNNYHFSIDMLPFESLYEKGYKSPIGWFEDGKVELLWVDLVRARDTIAQGHSREASLEPQVEIAEDQVPPEPAAPLLQETLLRMLGMLESFTQNRVGVHTPEQHHVLVAPDHMGQLLLVPTPIVGAQITPDMEKSRLRFKSLTQNGMSVAEYEAHFCQLSRHATILIPDEVERVRKFMKGLTLSIRSYVFRSSREGASFQSILSTAKEAELMVREKFGDTKRACTSGQFLGTSSGGRGTYRGDS